MTEVVEVRQATPSDAEGVYRLLTQFVVSYRPRREAFDQNLPELLTSSAAHLVVAIVSGKTIGYALALRVPTLYANGALWELQELMVAAEYRGQGAGRKLLEAVIDHAHTEGAVEVVVPTRRAGAYYEKFGFTETARYYKMKLAEQP